MSDYSSFERLPVEAITHIVDVLEASSPSSVFNLLFLKATSEIAQSFVYKTINLQNPDLVDLFTQSTLVKRILDPNDVVSNYVRDLEIETRYSKWDPAPKLDGQLIARILESIVSLRTFSWKSTQLIPKNVIDLFHSRFPGARLCYKNTVRPWPDMVMDLAILTSPQLYSLEYKFMWKFEGQHRSEMPVMTQIMSSETCKNLRILRFYGREVAHFQYDDYHSFYERFGVEGLESERLDFSPLGDQLAPLRELAFLPDSLWPPEGYPFDESHCLAWRSRMDWGQLQTLDLGSQGPSSFFEMFRGFVPNLKSLAFTLIVGDNKRYSVQNVDVVGNFIDSIESLEDLRLTLVTDGFFPNLWYFVKKLINLQSLEITTTLCNVHPLLKWSELSIPELQAFTRLTTLKIELQTEYHVKPDGGLLAILPKKSFAALSQLSQIRTLEISNRLVSEDHNPRNEGTFDIEPYGAILSDAFVDFFRHSLLSRLKALEFTGWRDGAEMGGDMMMLCRYNVIVLVRRLERDDAPSPLNGGYNTEVSLKDTKRGLWSRTRVH